MKFQGIKINKAKKYKGVTVKGKKKAALIKIKL